MTHSGGDDLIVQLWAIHVDDSESQGLRGARMGCGRGRPVEGRVTENTGRRVVPGMVGIVSEGLGMSRDGRVRVDVILWPCLSMAVTLVPK